MSIVCHICNKPISGHYHIDGWGHNICASHISNGEVVQCSSCSSFTTKTNTIPDGRALCNECFANSITDNKKIRSIFDSVISRLTSVGFSDLRTEDIEIEVVSAEFMANIRGGILDTRNKGVTQSTISSTVSLLGGSHKNMHHKVYILSHQTDVEFAGTLAHELLHAWQVQNGIAPPPKYCEGFCNLATYYVLSNIKKPIAGVLINNLKQNPDPIYGDGFREVFDWFEQTDWTNIITNYKNNNFKINSNLKRKTTMGAERFAGESAENFEQKCLCVLVLDASGSMRGEPLNALNEALKNFWHDILNDNDVAESLKDQIEIGVIQFDQEPKILREPKLLDDNDQIPVVTERGSTTETVAALKEAIQMVEDRKTFYKSSGQPYFRPWIVLMTDGAATSSKQAIDEMSSLISQKLAAKAFTIVGLGAGGYDKAELEKLAPMTLGLAGTKFTDFFKWLSCSMSTISQSTEGDSVNLVNDQFKAFQID